MMMPDEVLQRAVQIANEKGLLGIKVYITPIPPSDAADDWKLVVQEVKR